MTTPTIEKLQRELDEARAKMEKAESAARAAREKAEAERKARLDAYDRQRIAAYDRAALDQAVNEARKAFDAAVADHPVFAAWAKWNALIAIRAHEWVECSARAQQLGIDFDRFTPPMGEGVEVQHLLAAVNRAAEAVSGAHLNRVEDERTAVADGR